MPEYTESEVSALGDMIEQTGKRLTSIFITHGHLRPLPTGLGQLRSPISRSTNPSRPLPWSPTSMPRWS